MKLLGCFVVAVALAALVFWLLARLVGLPIAAVIVLAGLVAVRMVVGRLGKAVKKVSEAITPVEKTLSVPAGERFQGTFFAWTFPVSCEIEQTVLDDLETLLVKPAFDLWEDAPEVGLTVGTMSAEEMKEGTGGKLQEALALVPDLQAGDYTPVQVGPYSGEGKFLEGSSESGPVKGELIYLGDEEFSIAWSLITPADKFQTLADRMRQLAGLVERVVRSNTSLS